MSKTTIHRAPRGTENPYRMINRHAMEDDRLSFEARGVLGYILVKPDDWKINITDLRRQGSIGRDKAYKIINELIELGYCERIEHRTSGRITGYTYILHESPLTENTFAAEGEDEADTSDLPLSDLPDTESPLTANTDHTNKEDKQIKNITNKESYLPPSAGAERKAAQAEKPTTTKELHKHPAVMAYRDTFHRSMKRTQYPHVQHIDNIDKWTKVLTEWLLRGYNPTNLSGMLDWYRSGIPERFQKKQKVDTSRTDAWTVLPPLPPEEAARQQAFLMQEAERVFG